MEGREAGSRQKWGLGLDFPESSWFLWLDPCPGLLESLCIPLPTPVSVTWDVCEAALLGSGLRNGGY